jgi:hypothetical protein
MGEAGARQAAASDGFTAPAATSKMVNIMDRMDVLVSFIRPLLIYMRFWRLSG